MDGLVASGTINTSEARNTAVKHEAEGLRLKAILSTAPWKIWLFVSSRNAWFAQETTAGSCVNMRVESKLISSNTTNRYRPRGCRRYEIVVYIIEKVVLVALNAFVKSLFSIIDLIQIYFYFSERKVYRIYCLHRRVKQAGKEMESGKIQVN